MTTKPIAELDTGDQVVTTKTVKAAWTVQKESTRHVVFDDDTMQTYDLTGDPAIEIADA